MAIVGVILGVLSLFIGWAPLVGTYAGTVFGIIAVILGGIATKKEGAPVGLALAAVVLGLGGII
jgi:hypothetical protein